MTQKFLARDLLNLRTEQLHASVPDLFDIVFEDGKSHQSTKKKLIYSSYFWDIIRAYPNCPINFNHHVDSVLKGKPLSSNTHIDLLNNISKDVVIAYNIHYPEDKEHLLGMVYQTTNRVFNEVSKMAEEHVTSIDILDFIEIIEHPIVKEVTDNTKPTAESIDNTYQVIQRVINEDPTLNHNALAKAVKSKMVNANQVNQCVAVRGFSTEVDGSILKNPILCNYTRGMGELYNYVAESRSAAKSYYFSESPLQDSEYFARRLQLLTMAVEKIEYKDCGTNKYIQWRVNPPKKDDNGKVVYPGDLKFMIGKYYLDDDQQLKEIKGNEEHLFNKVIRMRSVLYCRTPNPHKVCEFCFGALSKNISRYANLGHLCAATVTQQTTQSVLSTKHLDASSVSVNIVLNEIASKYFTTNRGKNAYVVRKEMKDKNIRIVVNRDEAFGLTDVINIDDVNNINPIRISAIDSIDVIITVKGNDFTTPLFVNQGNRKAILTLEFLKYLKDYRWQTDNRNNFVFTLQNWDFNLPIIKLPDMEYSFSDHSHQIAKLIESSIGNIADRVNPDSPVATLQELFSLTNSKLNVNIAALEVIMYGMMTADKESYGLARHSEAPVLGVAKKVIVNRSLSPMYAFQNQIDGITDPRSFFKLDRPSSVFDVFLAPKEVVDEHNRRN